jgi:hypothetical protein
MPTLEGVKRLIDLESSVQIFVVFEYPAKFIPSISTFLFLNSLEVSKNTKFILVKGTRNRDITRIHLLSRFRWRLEDNSKISRIVHGK